MFGLPPVSRVDGRSSATRGLVHASGAGADADAGVRWCRDKDEWLLRESSVEVDGVLPTLLGEIGARRRYCGSRSDAAGGGSGNRRQVVVPCASSLPSCSRVTRAVAVAMRCPRCSTVASQSTGPASMGATNVHVKSTVV